MEDDSASDLHEADETPAAGEWANIPHRFSNKSSDGGSVNASDSCGAGSSRAMSTRSTIVSSRLGSAPPSLDSASPSLLDSAPRTLSRLVQSPAPAPIRPPILLLLPPKAPSSVATSATLSTTSFTTVATEGSTMSRSSLGSYDLCPMRNEYSPSVTQDEPAKKKRLHGFKSAIRSVFKLVVMGLSPPETPRV